jgi:hypothetical protein
VVVLTCFVMCGCVYVGMFCNVWVCVCVGFVMYRCVCGGFGNMCSCIYCVLYLYCVFCIVSFMYIYSYLLLV